MSEQQVFLTTKPEAAILAAGIDKSVEDDDPYALTGVRYPVAEGVDADREVALAIVEEFALSGWSADRIRELFAAPESGSMHSIARRRGEEFVDNLLGVVFEGGHLTKERAGG